MSQTSQISRPSGAPARAVKIVESIAIAVGVALVLGLVALGAAFHPYNIASGSMAPTLVKGDYLITSNLAYKFGGRPQRGDIVALKSLRADASTFVKRIVGLPGDRVQLKDGVVYLNGQPVEREAMGPATEVGPFGLTHPVLRFRETLPGGRAYMTFSYGPGSDFENTGVYVVPAGRYFVLGDNRDNSVDSRLPPDLGGGYVPFENLKGKAEAVISWSRNDVDGRGGRLIRSLR